MNCVGLNVTVKILITFMLKIKIERIISISPSQGWLESLYKKMSGEVNYDPTGITRSTRRKLDEDSEGFTSEGE